MSFFMRKNPIVSPESKWRVALFLSIFQLVLGQEGFQKGEGTNQGQQNPFNNKFKQTQEQKNAGQKNAMPNSPPEEYKQKETMSIEQADLIRDQLKQKRETRESEYKNAVHNALCPDPPANPMVSLRESYACLLTTRDYNSSVELVYSDKWRKYLHNQEDSIPQVNMHDLRKKILYDIVEEAYLHEKWREAQKKRLFNDSVKNETLRYNQDLLKCFSDSLLEVRYRQYYDDFFSPKNNSLFYVFSSTDSVLLDSILTATGRKWAGDTLSGKSQGNPLLKEGYSTYSYAYDSLPAEMRIIADSLKQGAWSPVKKTAWGYVAVGLCERRMRKEMRFEDAKFQLLHLPDKQRYQNIAVSDDRARAFFDSNKQLFQPRDTLYLSFTVMPHLFKKIAVNKRITALPDRCIMKMSQCRDSELPPEIVQKLAKYANFPKDTCTEWLDWNYGRWKFRLIDYKPANPVSFKDCKDEVKNYMQSVVRDKSVSEAVSIAGSKENDRSYQLFKNRFFYSGDATKRADEKKAVEKEIQKWAAANIQINSSCLEIQ